ncbi:hypothetical protein BGI03_04455 [Snodgrassella alvi]|nr:hypothetical protein BGH98_02075 [Snodgrassella alvi]ORF12651.1 hypothetical protein BGI01_06335 [Snodgrassella alvi]ORF19299.1 hypothetical protein BGI03_04455 [Snodgrassella alvi]
MVSDKSVDGLLSGEFSVKWLQAVKMETKKIKTILKNLSRIQTFKLKFYFSICILIITIQTYVFKIRTFMYYLDIHKIFKVY